MAVDPQDSPAGRDGGRHAELCAELRELRTSGLPRARTLHLPRLLEAAGELGHLDDDQPVGEALEAMLGHAVDRLGESREAAAARFTFGLVRGSKLSGATERRKAAAQAQGVSVERFRKGYEPLLVTTVAEQVLAMTAQAATTPAPVRVGPVFTGELQVAEVLAAARTSADWDLVEGVYRQCVDIAEDQDGHDVPPGVAGFLAEALGRIAANYYEREDELVVHALGILGNIDRSETISEALFTSLYRDERFDRFRAYNGTDGGPRRRPRPFETLVETARRYRDLHALRHALSGVPSAGILGGSVNYGRFFTVRGGNAEEPGSDLDLLVILPDYRQLAPAAAALRAVHAVSRDDLVHLDARVRLFTDHGFDDGRTVFSHPVTMWADRPDPVLAWAPGPGSYRLDLRFLSLAALDWLLVADTSKLNGGAAGSRRSVREYCPEGAAAEDHQRSFSGRNLRHAQPAEAVPGGLLRASRAYTIDGDDERYYPGVLQNLVLPRFAQRWESVPINGRLMAFRWKAIERLRYERRLRPYELLRMSLAHTRSEMFAPHVLRAVDGEDSTA